MNTSNEIKTKPTQHSVKELRSIGIQPDILVCRSVKRYSKIKKRLQCLLTLKEKQLLIQLM